MHSLKTDVVQCNCEYLSLLAGLQGPMVSHPALIARRCECFFLSGTNVPGISLLHKVAKGLSPSSYRQRDTRNTVTQVCPPNTYICMPRAIQVREKHFNISQLCKMVHTDHKEHLTAPCSRATASTNKEVVPDCPDSKMPHIRHTAQRVILPRTCKNLYTDPKSQKLAELASIIAIQAAT